jgi:pimeloyl-ACP methyl ester carboxylesterase
MLPPVILVHGLWFNGWEMALLGHRLRRCGFAPIRFPYSDVRRSPADNARRLDVWLRDARGEEIHFVAHSMGGILLLHFFHLFSGQRPGRVVFLGTPAAGSAVARRMESIPGMGWTLGRSVEAGLLGGAPPWSGGRDLGLVAGTLGVGVGRLFGALEGPHDGTVAVAETLVPGAKDRRCLPVSHTGLLVSDSVACCTCHFLHTGSFDPPP